MRRGGRGVPGRGDLLFAFDQAYAADPYRVYSIVEAAIAQVGARFGEIHLFCQGGYRGPRFLDRKPRIIGGKSGASRLFGRLAGRPLARARITESPARWTSNIAASAEPLLHALARNQNYGCVITFSADLELPITAFRLAHVFAQGEPPLLLAVTPGTIADPDDIRKLDWLEATLLCDAELAAATGNPVASARYAPAELQESGRRVGTIRFATAAASRFTRAETYPSSGLDHYPMVRWSEYADPASRPHPRARDVIMFVRPDWTHCGSATTFRNLARHFHERGALIIDVGIWPYAEPFNATDREARIAEEQREIDAALYFSVRQSNSLLRHLEVACAGIASRLPTTIVQQKLLQYALSAKPGMMRTVLRRAQVSHIYLNHFFTYDYARSFIHGRRFFLDTHDIQTTNWVQGGAINYITRRGDHFQTLMRDELRILSKAHRLSFVNDAELNLARQAIPEEKLSVIIALPDIAACARKPLGYPRRLLIVASRNLPNKRGMDWFLREVWPLILAGGQNTSVATPGIPPLILDVCGSIRLDFPDVRSASLIFHGQVDDLRSFYARADAVLLPVVTGGGVAIKTIEAILHGRPVIGTRHAFRGLPEEVTRCVSPENDAEQFASSVVRLLSSQFQIDTATASVRRAAALVQRQGYYDRLDTAMADVRLPPRNTLLNQVRHIVDRYFSQQERGRDITAKPAKIVLDSDPSWVASMFSKQTVHEEDYRIFKYFNDAKSLVLDIGANYGYSVASIFSTGCGSCVLSFEPVALLAPCLAEVVRLNPGRCDYRMTGLGGNEGEQIFVMPVVNNRGITALTTADPYPDIDSLARNICEYKSDHMKTEDFESLRFYRFTAPIKTLDNVLKSGGPFEVPVSRIVAAKIDTEGTEADILAGATDTLEFHRPLILIEGANRQPRVREMLLRVGYEFANRTDDRLVLSNEISMQPNGFFIHTSRVEEYQSSGLLAA